MTMATSKYRRILLKISGEALAGGGRDCFDPGVLDYLSGEIADALKLNTQIAVVVGGGNIVRGELLSRTMGVERVAADYMGMLATVINGMALESALTRAGIEARMQTALNAEQVAAPYVREKAARHLSSNHVMIFVRRHGQSVFFHRHGGGVACVGDGRGGAVEGDECRRRVFGRPADRFRRPPLRDFGDGRGDSSKVKSDGRDRPRPVPRAPVAGACFPTLVPRRTQKNSHRRIRGDTSDLLKKKFPPRNVKIAKFSHFWDFFMLQ